MKFEFILVALIAAFVLIPSVLGFARTFYPPGLDVSNTAGSHEGVLVTRISEVAIDSPYLMVRKGTADRQVLLGTATARPLGTAEDAVAITTNVGIRVLGGADSQIMVGNEAITVDSPVYTAADGKVSDTYTAGCWRVGTALTACAGDAGEFEVATCVPYLATPPVTVAAAGGAVTALSAVQGITLSNLGASGAATFTLPAAVQGMRVTAVVQVAQELRLDPNGAETIALPSTGVQGAAGKYLTANALTESVQLICLTTGTWDVISYTGTWTAEA